MGFCTLCDLITAVAKIIAYLLYSLWVKALIYVEMMVFLSLLSIWTRQQSMKCVNSI